MEYAVNINLPNRGIAENIHMPNGTQQDAELLRLILDSATIGIWMLGVDGSIRFGNMFFCNAVGVAEARLIGAAHYADALPLQVAAGFTKSDRECYEQYKPHVST